MSKPPQHLTGGLSIAVLLNDGFEQVEMTGPRKALEESGAMVKLVSVHKGQVQGWNHDKPADKFTVDLTVEQAKADDFDAVLLPGGVQNADTIRSSRHAQEFVRSIDRQGKPLAVICHGGWLLVSAGLVKGRKMTSWPSLQDDIRNAGGDWVDEEAVTDRNWVSSRKPNDIPAFNKAFLALLGKRVKESVKGTADDAAAAAGTGG
jgi:protease I